MTRTRPRGHHTSLPARVRRAALVAVTATVLAACGGGDEEAAPEAPPAEPGQPITVTGRAGLVFHDLSTSGTLVFPDGEEGDLPVEADEPAIQAAADAIRGWLDMVLTERNRGETTTVAGTDVDATAFAAAIGADGPATQGVLDTQVADATYLIEVGYLGTPGWALARVESVLVDADAPDAEVGRRLDSFVFAIDDTGAVEFLALEVAP